MITNTVRRAASFASVWALVAVAGSVAARADGIYSDRTSFTVETSGLTNIDFEGIAAAGAYVSYGAGLPLMLSGVTFTSVNGPMFVIDPGFYGFSYANGAFLTSAQGSPFATANLLVASLPTGVTAIGFDFGGLFNQADLSGVPAVVTFGVTLSDGTTATVSSGDGSIETPPLGFVGFTSSTDISTVQITMPDAIVYNAIDNFSFGSAAPVPEPSSFGMLTASLIALGIREIRLRR